MKIHQKSKYRGIDDINNLKDLFGQKRTLKKQENIDQTYQREFQGRLGKVDRSTRPVVKGLQKQA